MTACIFIGPTLPARQAARACPAIYMPPVRQGDVYRAVRRLDLDAIGIIDGYFDQVPSVWHKEILWAMAQGVRVYGAASMGALRAAELADYGMHGVGVVYEAYRDGVFPGYEDEPFLDDDEVALVHGPLLTGFAAQSEAMVNIRATLSEALAAGVIEAGTKVDLTTRAKTQFYPRRTWQLLTSAEANPGIEPAQLRALQTWLEHGRIDQKREDALALLGTMAERPGEAFQVSYTFEHTRMWERLAATER